MYTKSVKFVSANNTQPKYVMYLWTCCDQEHIVVVYKKDYEITVGGQSLISLIHYIAAST